jgi:D-aminopeptidase
VGQTSTREKLRVRVEILRGTPMPEKMVMGGSGSPKEELGIGLGCKAVQQRYRPRWLWPAIRTMLETGVCRRCNNALLFKLFIDVNKKR